ncbi:MAG TPA: 4-hydroxy-2-oxovalerate aldolase [Candidatus Omnitrophota bacterium]|nr:4-hydroxy-2-oxovalerate aldolase [Candidatus Omnitrophota bacterium]HPD85573.1 4-hydroxy-2-oxovalerate aldolase [Candidatus Omnitrophota bacterium]HRZ04387.1 4-hydroxy-2-oxovalerate aldolase [Candidatus Omnitrophota bacterium]
MTDVFIIDSSLRDGSHAIRHQLDRRQIESYCAAAETAGVPIVMVGHGNGLGASSLQVGESLLTDQEMIACARGKLSRSKLGVFIIPGFGTINKDLGPAIEQGVDVVCVSSHCTEADTTQRHINYVKEKGKLAYGNLMMTHMVSKEILIDECLKMQSYDVDGVIIMDSAGAYITADVKERIAALAGALKIPVGFHAHNNLGLAIANSVAAIEAGATILDCCILGFGAGAGNTQMEAVVAILNKMGYKTGIDLYKILDLADMAAKELFTSAKGIKSISIVSGLAGVFSGFVRHVERVSLQYGVDAKDVFFELGRRKAVGGQEDMIVEVAISLVDKQREKRQ